MQKRLDRLLMPMRGEKPDRVPIMLDFETSYMCEYAGIDFLKATWDYEDLIKAYEKILQDFQMDINTGVYWISPHKSEILGSKNWVQNRVNGSMQHPEVSSLLDTEYNELIADPFKCIQERIIPRIHSNLSKSTYESNAALVKALMFEKNQVTDFYNKVYDKSYEYNMPIYFGTIFYAPFDLLADHIRGIGNASIDMRRRSKEVEAACEVLKDMMVEYVEKTLPVSEEGFPFACSWVHLPPMINPKQFERFFWPTFKYVCDSLAEKGYTIYLQFQGDYTDGKYFDYFQELPENKTVISVEHQDFKLTMEKLGKKNIVCAGYPLHYLTNNSTKECIDKARELMEIGMESGRFYFGFNKPAFTLSDAKPEKMKAVLDFVKEFGVY